MTTTVHDGEQAIVDAREELVVAVFIAPENDVLSVDVVQDTLSNANVIESVKQLLASPQAEAVGDKPLLVLARGQGSPDVAQAMGSLFLTALAVHRGCKVASELDSVSAPLFTSPLSVSAIAL